MSAPTETDLHRSALLIGFTAGASAMAIAVMFILTFIWRPESC